MPGEFQLVKGAMTSTTRFFNFALLLTAVGQPACKSIVPASAQIESVAPGHSIFPPFNGSFGRYLGFLQISDDAKMSVVMDLAPSMPRLGQVQMRAVLRFHLGDFESTEFASFYFPEVGEGFDGKVHFGESEESAPKIRIENALLSDGKFSARVVYPPIRDGVPARSGFIEARLSNGATNEIRAIGGKTPAIGLLSGQYAAICDGQQSTLQLEYSRWNQLSADPVVGFLSDGVLTGRIGVTALSACKLDSLNCFQRVFKGGSFDPFTGQLLLQSSSGDSNCHVSGASIHCDACSFARSQVQLEIQAAIPSANREAKAYSRNEDTIFEVGPPVDLESEPAALAGSFYGYLHHEATNAYQAVSLNLAYTPESGNYSAVSAVYFGPAANNEFIAYRFDPVSKDLLSNRVVLDGPGESFLILTASGSKGLGGVWYSKTHGRVGTVSFARDSMPPLMVDESFLVTGLSGRYSGETWQFELKVAANVSENPREFYPLRIFGSAREVADSQKRRLIQDGTFDFYTGMVALRLDDGRTIVGRVQGSGMKLFWPPWPRLGPVPDAQSLQTFIRVDQADRTIAARK